MSFDIVHGLFSFVVEKNSKINQEWTLFLIKEICIFTIHRIQKIYTYLVSCSQWVTSKADDISGYLLHLLFLNIFHWYYNLNLIKNMQINLLLACGGDQQKKGSLRKRCFLVLTFGSGYFAGTSKLLHRLFLYSLLHFFSFVAWSTLIFLLYTICNFILGKKNQTHQKNPDVSQQNSICRNLPVPAKEILRCVCCSV